MVDDDVVLCAFAVDQIDLHGLTFVDDELGIYGAVVGLANGLRRVSQPFTPIFAPVVAGMTASGAHEDAGATYSRLLEWMLQVRGNERIFTVSAPYYLGDHPNSGHRPSPAKNR